MIARKLVAGIAASLALIATGAQANLVTNGGFEDGTTGWSTNGWSVTNSTYGVSADDGSLFAYTGCVASYCTLSQDLTTVAGGTYSLTFAFNPGADVTISGADTKVYWNGTVVADLGLGEAAWTVYTIGGLVATGTDTTLEFSGYQNPAWNGVDDVSVTSTVPEPAMGALMLAGLGLAGVAARRKRSN